MPTPAADKPKPDKPNPDKPRRPPSPPRRKNRFNEREFARAVRAAAAAGAEGLELDPKTGVYRVVLPGKGARADRNPWDEVLNNAADQKRPA